MVVVLEYIDLCSPTCGCTNALEISFEIYVNDCYKEVVCYLGIPVKSSSTILLQYSPVVRMVEQSQP